jgi:signal transduction histidine kinase
MPGQSTCDDNHRVDTVNGSGVARQQYPALHRYGPVAGIGLLGLGAVIETLVHRPAQSVPGLIVLLCLVGLATTLPLSVPRPTAPGTAVVVAGVLSLSIFHTLTVAGCVAQLVAAYLLGHRGAPTVAAIAIVPYLLIAATATGHIRAIGVLLAAGVPAVALLATAHRMHRNTIENQATRQAIAGTLLEHTARGERARISRELHDVVAHHISMIAVQAETARLTAPELAPATAQRLRSIGDTARAGLTEMRRLLGVLREDTGAAAADRQPQPGLVQLNELLDEARDASGAATRLIVSGLPVILDPGVELAAYRIVQEALTNARRHATGAAVDVELRYAGDGLRLRIRDNGPGPLPVPPEGGHGLLGMRERAAAVGGMLTTGAAPGGGFLITARLPGKADGP